MQTAPPPGANGPIEHGPHVSSHANPHANAPKPYLSPPGGYPPAMPGVAMQPGVEWMGRPPYRQGPAWVPPPPPKPAARPAPLRIKELAAAGAVAVACDLALWSHDGLASGGFGMALFFVAVPVALALAARAHRMSPRLGVVVGLLAAVAARCVFDPTGGTVLSGLGLLAVFTMTLRARRIFVPEAVASAFAAIGKLPSRIGAAFAGVQRIAARTRVGNVSLLPIVVPIALCAVFAGVFALANPVVAHGLGVAWSAIASIVGFPSPVRIFVWMVSLIGAFALLRPAIRLAKGTEAAAEEGEATATGLLVARNALAALNVLFLLYNALDAAYLWAGAPPAGMRTQQYAHQGAFWLTIALVMCTGVIGVMFRGPLAHDLRAKTARTLAYAWMAQGLVLALGTYRRIAIHIAHSGLSDLRIVGILGTTLVVAGVVTVALKLKSRHTFTWLVRRQLDAFAITLVLYAVCPTHLVSARVNVARIEGGEYPPVLHMFRQSSQPESAAELLPLLHHSDVRVRQGVASLLEHEHEALAADVAKQGSWRERDVASRRTLARLDAAGPEIASVLGKVDRAAARQVLLEISRVANEGRSLEELLAVPDADEWSRRGGTRLRSDAY
jgi:hypothetical protein